MIVKARLRNACAHVAAAAMAVGRSGVNVDGVPLHKRFVFVWASEVCILMRLVIGCPLVHGMCFFFFVAVVVLVVSALLADRQTLASCVVY